MPLQMQTLVFHQRLLKLLELYGISKDCREDILHVNIGLENGEEWAHRSKKACHLSIFIPIEIFFRPPPQKKKKVIKNIYFAPV